MMKGCMGWFEILIVVVLIVSLVAVLLSWEMRSFGLAAVFALVLVVGVVVMMQSSLGDQIRKELLEKKAASGSVKRTG